MADLRALPKVDVLASSQGLRRFPEVVRVQASRFAVDQMRSRAKNGAPISLEDCAAIAVEQAEKLSGAFHRRVINLSGVILHTGLGRARLSQAAADRLFEVASHHAIVEFEPETGKRGDRQTKVREQLRQLTGAESALVVNNAAAAVFLSLQATSVGREVVLSRGQMVEIGGSFRLPDIVGQSGCRLVEVGCTNKTRLSDFASAINEETSAVLRCHPSNFKIIGFASQPTIRELADLCRTRGVLLLDDVGSGCLVDVSRFGLPKQPTLQDSVAAGADLVMASGDKLLGGPQCGIILGRADLVAQVASHPLARALRVDKLTLAALEATLGLYMSGEERQIPVLRYMARDLSEVRRAAGRLAAAFGDGAAVDRGETEVGGGSLPGEGIPTWRVGIPSSDPEALLAKLRSRSTPIIGRIEDGKVWLDPRTAEKDEVSEASQALREISGG